MHRFVLVLLFFFSSASVCDAADLAMTISPSQGTALSHDKMYTIDINCVAKTALPSSDHGGLGSLFISDKRTMSHFVLVTPAATNAAVPITTTLGASSLLSLAFSVDQGGGTTVDNRTGCHQRELLTNPTSMYFVGVAAYSKTVTAGTIGTLFNNVVTVATALAPVFTGNALAANVAKNLSSVSSAIPPLNALISVFDPNKVKTSQVQDELKEGVSKIDTQYSEITITVTPVDSVVTDADPVYRAALEQRVSSADVKVDTTSNATLAASCALDAGLLEQAGFHSSKDETFGIVYASLKSIATKDQLYTCLGQNRAETALSLGDVLWHDVPPELVFTRGYLDSVEPPPAVASSQPTFQDVEGPFGIFTQLLGRYAKTATPSASMVASLKKFTAQDVGIDDSTGVFDDSTLPPGCPAFFDALIGQGYHHFGFFAQVTDSKLLTEYGSNVGLIAFKTPADVDHAPPTDAIVLFPIYNQHVIARFKVSGSLDEVKLIIGSRTSTDNFTIDPVPASTSSPATVVAPHG